MATGDWVCDACNAKNPDSSHGCHACLKRKKLPGLSHHPKGEELVGSTVKKFFATKGYSKVDTVIFQAPGFQARHEMSHKDFDTLRSRQPLEEGKKKQKKSEGKVVIPWNCAACSFLNTCKEDAKVCSMCKTPRKTQLGDEKTTSTPGGTKRQRPQQLAIPSKDQVIDLIRFDDDNPPTQVPQSKSPPNSKGTGGSTFFKDLQNFHAGTSIPKQSKEVGSSRRPARKRRGAIVLQGNGPTGYAFLQGNGGIDKISNSMEEYLKGFNSTDKALQSEGSALVSQDMGELEVRVAELQAQVVQLSKALEDERKDKALAEAQAEQTQEHLDKSKAENASLQERMQDLCTSMVEEQKQRTLAEANALQLKGKLVGLKDCKRCKVLLKGVKDLTALIEQESSSVSIMGKEFQERLSELTAEESFTFKID
eukprot:CAMPEP_0117748520 /NCGR_PEP_ID=MMETSP0947-20121206/9182_1 /TAXON_ID=44440 /ORGANISM="Chattonella subsalsa, Strain CCMP2191" /LENGTH=422 /DNA_ID=CAMNT_0005566233 /DNA_START=108 /DNA_END=1377 /DNA_ORIENTATION=+